MGDPVNLSPHFTLAELTRSNRALVMKLDNTPGPAALANLKRLCVELGEPVRAQFGPLYVSSGYRSPALNGQTPGASATSAHPDGRAMDVTPAREHTPADLIAIVQWVAASDLPFDQVIYECVPQRDRVARWVHLGIAAEGRAPRRQALMTFDGRAYAPFDVSRLGPDGGPIVTATAARAVEKIARGRRR